jgi:hypothetical protein
MCASEGGKYADQIDLYQAHTDDSSTPLEDTLGIFDELVKEGKVRVYRSIELRGLRAWLRPLKLAASLRREVQVNVIPCFSLVAGFLTG